MYRILFLTSIILTIYTTNISAQNALQRAIDAMADESILKHASYGVCVIDVEKNEVIAAHEADKSLIPASSLKVVTTATALGVLGRDYRFKTELAYDGELDANGTLRGNIYIKGYGDPTLASPEMEGVMPFETLMKTFCEAIKTAGIKRLEGYVLGDASFFETATVGRTWIWEDMGNYYAGGASGLNIHENLYYLDFEQSPSLNTPPKLKTTRPEVPDLVWFNELTSAGAKTGDNAYIFGAPYASVRYVRGTLPIGKGIFTVKGAMPESAYFAAYHLADLLEKDGYFTGKCVGTTRTIPASTSAPKVIYTHQSPPLHEIVQRANMKSVNLYCESFLKAMGQAQNATGTTEAGLAVIREYWSARGVNLDGFKMKDGCGLSPRNTLTTRQLAQIMRKILKDEKIFDDIKKSLPTAAKSGALARMFSGTALAGNLRAKSGYMSGVRSYTGYLTDENGRLLTFSIIANNHTGNCKKLLETVMEVMYSSE